MKQYNNETMERGVSIYLAIMVMTILLAIGLGISVILISQLRMIRGMEDSVIAFYAADTGIERILYDDKICHQQTPCDPSCIDDLDGDGYCNGLISPYNTGLVTLNGASYKASHEHEIEQPTGPGCAVDTLDCPGIICCDFTGDGVVTSEDVDIVGACYSNPAQCTEELIEDANCSGTISAADVVKVSLQADAGVVCDYLFYNFKSVGAFKKTKRAIKVSR